MNAIVILCDTLRRDHIGAYSGGKPLNQCWSKEAPSWRVPTPNFDRLARRGTVFDQCHAGSSPCMPARRDIYTGRFEFLERGWGPLEEFDLDLPHEVSGPSNRSIPWALDHGYRISSLITDHFHLWERGSGNYHMGYTGFDFVRGVEADNYRTDWVEGYFNPYDRTEPSYERHWRNAHLVRKKEEDHYSAQVYLRAADWLERNRNHKDFYLHLDIFDPHEPWDPPEDYIRMFDSKGTNVPGVSQTARAPYKPWRLAMSEEEFDNLRARYAAKVVFQDKWLGVLLDKMDALDLWRDTLVILTADHGTFNGDHGRMGKLQTHEFDAKSHVPFIAVHPESGHGERRDQLVQLVDIYPTVLAAVGRPVPERLDGRRIHGVNLLPVLEDAGAKTRTHALAGQFGKSVTITDGDWTLHQSPVLSNQPLFWHGCQGSWFLPVKLGPHVGGCRAVSDCESWPEETWLSDKQNDPNELVNLATVNPRKVAEMQMALRDLLKQLDAPAEQEVRLGLTQSAARNADNV